MTCIRKLHTEIFAGNHFQHFTLQVKMSVGGGVARLEVGIELVSTTLTCTLHISTSITNIQSYWVMVQDHANNCTLENMFAEPSKPKFPFGSTSDQKK